MTLAGSFDYAHPLERDDFGLDFGPRLTTGETIAQVSVTLVRVGGTPDPNPSAMLDGAPVVVGAVVVQRLAGGVDGAVYELRALAETSAGRELQVRGRVPVRALGC